jgi:hypothetical protein
MFVLVVVLALAATAPAETVAAPAANAADPNEKICENMAQIGSRLAKRRVCATRAEWAERRLQDRQDAEKIQRSITGSTCAAVRTNGSSTC